MARFARSGENLPQPCGLDNMVHGFRTGAWLWEDKLAVSGNVEEIAEVTGRNDGIETETVVAAMDG